MRLDRHTPASPLYVPRVSLGFALMRSGDGEGAGGQAPLSGSAAPLLRHGDAGWVSPDVS